MADTVYLIRHATPDWSRKELIYHLPPGPPLTQQGIAEAESLGHYLHGSGLSCLYASPLERSLKTAQIMAEITGASLKVDERLIEWQPDELLESVQNRLKPVFLDALQDSQNGKLAGLVTHGGPVGAILRLLGMKEEKLKQFRIYDSNNPLPPGGAWQVTRSSESEDWTFTLVFEPLRSYEQSIL